MSPNKSPKAEIECLAARIVACRRCERLNAWRAETAAHPPKRYQGETYHAKPVPGFGDPRARVFVVGLAPAAHGANRTGRMFTGDRSGDWLYRAMHRAGFANQPTSERADDGLALTDCYITAVCRCAPPGNKPLPEEIENCAEYLDRELEIVWPRLRAVVCLGSIAYDNALRTLARRGIEIPKPKNKFAHARVVEFGAGAPRLILSYHPSQQNTFTGKLTEPMFDEVWAKAREGIEEERK